MWAVITLGLGVGMVGLVVLTATAAVRENAAAMQRQRGAWRRAGRQLGLKFEPGSVGQIGELSGVFEGRQVVVEHQLHGQGGNHRALCRVQIALRDHIPEDLVVTGDLVGPRLGRLLRREDQEIGVEPFDDRFVLQGDEAALFAALGGPARRALFRHTRTVGGGAGGGVPVRNPAPQVGDGWVELGVIESVSSVGRIQELIRSAATLAELIDGRGSQAEALYDSAVNDPQPAVRGRAAEILVERWPDSPQAAEVGPAMEAARRASGGLALTGEVQGGELSEADPIAGALSAMRVKR